MQTNDAEQAAIGTGRLRGRESGALTEDVLAQVGADLHAGGGTGQVSNPSDDSSRKSSAPYSVGSYSPNTNWKHSFENNLLDL